MVLWLASLVSLPDYALAHGGGTHGAPIEVCSESTLGDGCQWTDDHGSTYIGTCRGAEAPYYCIRNRPIIRAASSDSEVDVGGPPGATAHAIETDPSRLICNVGLLVVVLLAVLAFAWKRRSA